MYDEYIFGAPMDEVMYDKPRTRDKDSWIFCSSLKLVFVVKAYLAPEETQCE